MAAKLKDDGGREPELGGRADMRAAIVAAGIGVVGVTMGLAGGLRVMVGESS